jgi:hypothetical protein
MAAFSDEQPAAAAITRASPKTCMGIDLDIEHPEETVRGVLCNRSMLSVAPIGVLKRLHD